MTINKQHNRSAWWDMGNKVISQPAIKEFCRNPTFFRLSKESSSNTTIKWVIPKSLAGENVHRWGDVPLQKRCIVW